MPVQGQLWFATDTTAGVATDSRVVRINDDGSNLTTVRSSIGTPPLAPSDIALFPQAGVYFLITHNVTTGQGASLLMGTIGGGVPIVIENFAANYIVNAVAVDTSYLRIFVGIQDAGGNAAVSGIKVYDFNPISRAVTPSGLFTTAALDGKPADPFSGQDTLDVRDFDLISGNTNLYFTEERFDTVHTQGVYRTDWLSGSFPPTIRVVSAAQFPDDHSQGTIRDVEIGNGMVYFSVHSTAPFNSTNPTDPNYVAAQNKIWFVAAGSTNATATALVLGGLPGGAHFFPGDIVFDAATNQLYVESEEDGAANASGFSDDVIYVFQLDPTGTTGALIHTFAMSPAFGNSANIDALAFDSLPVLDVTGTSSHPQTGGAAVTLLTAVPTLSDPDQDFFNTYFASATVVLSGAVAAGDDSLSVLASALSGTSITASYSSASHTLTLSGYDTNIHYQQALLGVRYTATGPSPNYVGANANRIVTWNVSDGVTAAGTNQDTTSFTVDANQPPVAADHVGSSDEDVTVQFGSAFLLGGATDPENDTLTVVGVSNATHGSVSFNSGTGSVTFIPTSDYFGPASFDFTISDGHGNTDVGTTNLSINPVNDAPVFTSPVYPVETISSAGAVQGNGSSSQAAFSPDGTRIVFTSSASNLVAGDTNNATDIFVKNLVDGSIVRVSTSSAGAQGNAGSGDASFSPDGTKIVFVSNASNLAAGDTNLVSDIFLKDLTTGTLTRITTSTIQRLNYDPIFSPDGTRIAFVSLAGLAAGDSNANDDVYIYNLASGLTTLASRDAAGNPVPGYSRAVVFSPDGNKVAFHTNSGPQLLPPDQGGGEDVLIKDLVTGALTRVSVNSTGTQANNTNETPVFSPDGTMVAFVSTASNLPGLIPSLTLNFQVLVKNLVTGALVRLPTNLIGNGGSGDSLNPSFSPDGTKIVFDSNVTDLVGGDLNASRDIFVADLSTGAISRISLGASGLEVPGTSARASFSADGSRIVFDSTAALATGDSNGASDIYVVTLPTLSPAYVENGAAVTVAPVVNAADVDSPDFADGSLTVTITGGSVAGDTLSIFTSATPGHGIELSGGSISYEGTIVGALTATATSLSVALNANAGAAAVEAISEAVRIASTSEDPTSAPRTITFTLVDGDGIANGGHDSASFTREVAFNPVNDAPTQQANFGLVVVEGTTATITAAELDYDDVDQADNAITYTLSSAVTNGTLRLNSNALGVGGTFTQADLDANLVTYQHDGSETTSASFGFSVSDGAGGSVTGQNFAITVTPANDAPMLADTNVSLDAIDEDPGGPVGAVGTLVSSLVGLGGNVTDADIGAVTGIAVTGFDTSHGNWFISTDGGATWLVPFGQSDASALLLAADADTRLYFLPNANFNGTLPAAITFRAWDQSEGGNGGSADTTTGSSAFSSATDTASLVVNPINDKPSISTTSNLLAGEQVPRTINLGISVFDADLAAKNGGSGDYAGSSYTIHRASGANAQDFFDFLAAGASFTLSGNNILAGGLVFATMAQSGGSLQIDFTSTGTIATRALVQNLIGHLRYTNLSDNPDASVQLEYAFIDGAPGHGQGPIVGTDGDRSVRQFTITIQSANDAPVLVDTNVVLTSVDEDGGEPSGAVGTLVSSLVDFSATAGGQNNVADVDNGAVTGIAVIGADSHGIWYFTLDNGASWTPFGSVSDPAALLLPADANTRVYFQPDFNFNGSLPAALTFRAWDQSVDVAAGAAGDKVDASGVRNGGASAFSTATDIASLVVNAINDKPSIGTTSDFVAGEQVPRTINLGISVFDADLAAKNGGSGDYAGSSYTIHRASGANALDSFDFLAAGASFTISGNNILAGGLIFATMAQSGGSLQIDFTSTGTIATQALVQNLIGHLRYTNLSDNPDASVQLEYVFIDGAPGHGQGTIVGTDGDRSIRQVTVTITPVNDAPVLANANLFLSGQNEDSGAPSGAAGTLVSDLVNLNPPAGGLDNVTDADGAVTGIAVIATDTAHGSWLFTTDNGAHWTAVGAVANDHALLLAAAAGTRLYFQPAADFNGPLASAITLRAWDQSNGSNGAYADATTAGGSTAFSTATDTASLVVNAVNDAPAISSTGPISVNEQTAIRLNTAMAVSDVDLDLLNGGAGNYGGASFVITRLSGPNADDQFSFDTSGASFTISGGNLLSGGLRFASFTPGALFQIAFDSSGTVATRALVNDVLQHLLYTNGSDAPPSTVTLHYALLDGSPDLNQGFGPEDRDQHDVTVTINAIDDAPVLSATAFPASYSETLGTPSFTGLPALLFFSVTITDLDDSNMESARVTIANPVAGDLLDFNSNFTLPAGLSANFAANVLTITGSGTLADYQSVLKAVVFANAGDNPTVYDTNTNRTIGFVVNDGISDSNTQNVSVTVIGTNDAPFTTAGAPATLAEDATGAVLAGVSIADPDADPAAQNVTVTFSVTHGEVAMLTNVASGIVAGDISGGANGSASVTVTAPLDRINATLSGSGLTYTPTAGFSGTAQLTIFADDNGHSGGPGFAGIEATKTINVIAVNDAPVISIGAGDSAAATIVESNAGLAATGTLTVVDPDLSDTVTASVSGLSISGTTTGNPLSNAALQALLTVTGGSLAADPGAVHNLGWSFDSAGQAFDYLDDGESLVLNYTVQVVDAAGAVDTQDVTVTIAGTNDAPVISFGDGDVTNVTVNETNDSIIAAGSATLIDPDQSDSTTIFLRSLGLVGTKLGLQTSEAAVLSRFTVPSPLAADPGSAGNLTWSFNSGTEHFDYLDDGESLTLNFGTGYRDDNNAGSNFPIIGSVTIIGTNDAPVISVGSGDSEAATLAETNAGLAATGSLTLVDPDLSDAVTAAVIGVAAGGTTAGIGLANSALKAMMSVSAGTIAADPGSTHNLGWSFDSAGQAFNYLRAGESLVLTYTLGVTDDNGVTDSQDVTVTITGSNDAPVANATGTAHIFTENGPPLPFVDAVTISDADNARFGGGSLAISASDGQPDDGLVILGNLGLDVDLNAGTIELDGRLVATITGPGQFSLTANANAAAVATLIRSLAYTNSSNDPTGGIRHVTITFTDGSGTANGGHDTATINATINVVPVDDPPAWSLITTDSAAGTVIEADSTLSTSGTLTVRDPELADAVTVGVQSVAASGATGGVSALSVAPLSMLSLTGGSIPADPTDAHNVGWTFNSGGEAFNYLAVGQALTLTYTLRATDGSGLGADRLVAITITGTNDAPTASATGIAHNFTENGPPLALIDAVTIADVDNSRFPGGTLTFGASDGAPGDGYTILGNLGMDYDPGAGTIEFNGRLLATVTGPGQLTLTNNANAAAVEALIRSLAYTNSSDDPTGGTRHVSIVFTDGSGTANGGHDSVTIAATVTVVPVNDPPIWNVIGTDSAGVVIDEANGNLAATGTLTINDPELADAVTLSVQTTNATGNTSGLPAAWASMLSATSGSIAANPGDVHNASWTFDSGVFAFDYLAAGETVALDYRLRATDGSGAAADQHVVVTIHGTNDAPTAGATGTAHDFTENGPPLALVDAVAIADVDNSRFPGGTLSFSASDGAAGDGYTILGNFGMDYDPGAGTIEFNGRLLATVTGPGQLTLTNNANAVAVETLIRSLAFTNSSDDPTAGTRHVSIVFTDGSGTADGGHDSVTIAATVTVIPVNDPPDWSVIGTDSASIGLVEGPATLSTSGTLTLRDPELADAVTVQVQQVAVSGAPAPSISPLSMLTLTSGAIPADPGDIHNVGWTFDSGGESFDYLATGQVLTLTYTLRATDGGGLGDDQMVTITITGSNDAPIIIGGSNVLGAVTELPDHAPGENIATLTDSGAIHFADGDPSDTHDAGFLAQGGAYLGAFTLGSVDQGADSVGWSFSVSDAALNGLASGQIVKQYYDVSIDDGHGGIAIQTVEIDLVGTNDAAVLSSANVFLEQGAGVVTASGTLTITDEDGPALFLQQIGEAGRNGHFSIDAAGHWSFTANSAFSLGAGQFLSDVFTVLAADGTPTTVAVTITGPDAPAAARPDLFATGEASILGAGLNLFLDNGFGVDNDPNSPLQIVAVDGVAGNVGHSLLLASGARVIVNADGSFAYDTNHAWDWLTAATGAANQFGHDGFSYSLAGGSTAQVSVTILGQYSPGDIIYGDGADNVITAAAASDTFRLDQAGHDTANGAGGNDGFYFGKAFDSGDAVDGGSGTDTLALQGQTDVDLGSITNVEVVLALSGSDTRFGDTANHRYDYDLTTNDGNVAAGQTLTVQATGLLPGEDMHFDGSAESDGNFRIFAGQGTDVLIGGGGNDGFFFGADGNLTGADHVEGGAGIDSLALRGNYVGPDAVVFQNGSLSGIEVLAILSGHTNEYGGTIVPNGFDYDVTLADGNVAAATLLDVNAVRLGSDESLRFDGRAESDGSFRILSGAGDDTLWGGSGNDLLYGAMGADRLNGGAGADTFLYRFAAESTGTSHDTITGFDWHVDRIDAPGGVRALGQSATGELSAATFDDNLAAGLAGMLGAGQAALFTGNGGDLSGHVFAVIDGNGIAGYQAGEDLVIELVNAVLPIDPMAGVIV